MNKFKINLDELNEDHKQNEYRLSIPLSSLPNFKEPFPEEIVVSGKDIFDREYKYTGRKFLYGASKWNSVEYIGTMGSWTAYITIYNDVKKG